MQKLLEQMHTLTSLWVGMDTTQSQGSPTPLLDAPDVVLEPTMPRRTRWQLKYLKPFKYNGTIASQTTDAVEQWLYKWEQCFWFCNITDDVAKIQQATYNLLDVAHRWWCKVEQDNVEPSTWKDFKVIFYNNFVPPNERNKALDSWFFMSQKNYLVQNYADRY